MQSVHFNELGTILWQSTGLQRLGISLLPADASLDPQLLVVIGISEAILFCGNRLSVLIDW